MTLRIRALVPDRGVDVDLTLAPGETVALLGPNGSGKSTVLGVVAGHLRTPASRVVLGDRDLTSTPPHRRPVGLLAQDALLFPHLTAAANVAFGPRARGAGRSAARATAAVWLARVGAEALGERRPAQLSGGQAQRVAVARALAVDPEVVLLDEPMAALDVDATPALRHLLREVLRDRTAVVATHDVLDALLLADRVVVLDAGRVVEDGPAADVLTRPRSAFAARVAGLNLVGGHWVDGSLRAPDGSRVAGRAHGDVAEGDEVVAVFRPAAVSVFREAPAGSPRNAWATTLTALEPYGDQVRLRAGELTALVTPQAAAELALQPGSSVVLSVKANEVEVYPR